MFSQLISLNERKSNLILSLVVVLVFMLGAMYSLYLGEAVRFYPDECDYADLAHNLVNAGAYTIDGLRPTAFRPPGYPLYLAVVAMGGGGLIHFRILNYLALAAILVWVHRILNEQATPFAALLGAVLVAGYPLAFYTAGALYPQLLAGALFLLVVYLFTHRAANNLHYILGGIFLGWLVLTVPSFIFTLPVFILWQLWARPVKRLLPGWLYAFVAAALLIGAWTVRNFLVFDAIFFVSTNAGENLLVGNSENTTPNAGRTAAITQYRVEADALSEVARDRYLGTKALEFIRTHKVHTIRLYFLKVLNYFNFRNDLRTNDIVSTATDLVMLLTYGPLLLLFVIRLALYKQYPLPAFEILLVALYLVNALVSAIFITRIRLRLPFDFLLILLDSLFLERLIRGRPGKFGVEPLKVSKDKE